MKPCVAALFAISVFAALSVSCGLSDAQVSADGPGTAQPPVVSAPMAKYSFYEPSSEDALQRDTNYGHLIAKVKPRFKESMFARLGLEVLGRVQANGATYYHLRKAGDVLGGIRDVERIAGVMYVEPEMNRQTKMDLEPISYDFPDPYTMSAQWGAHAIKALDAWRTFGFGPNRPVVAAVDTGVRFNHEDFQDGDRNMIRHAYSWYGPASNSPLDIGNFPLEDPVPVDYRNHATITSTDYSPGSGHGSHTAGTMCAVGNNGKGVAGVCWNMDLVSYKGLYSTAEGTGGNLFTVYASLWHLVKWKKDSGYGGTIPVNMSLGGLWASKFEIDMIEHALQNGVMVIAASGNDHQRLHGYPSAYAGVLAVGATNGGDKRASFSNWGGHISVVAPGQGVVSTYGGPSSTGAGNGYVSMSGTSMAAPHVTGLAGYMLTFNPNLKPDEIKTYIERSADFVGGATGFTEEYGWGRINVLNTIRAVVDDLGSGARPPSDYVHSPVKIQLPHDDVTVYLYQCDPSGKIANYVASAISGTSFIGAADGTVEFSVVNFDLLRPGHYVAKAHSGGEVGGTGVFQVGHGEQVPKQYIYFRSLKIQTLGTHDFKRAGDYADTEIWLHYREDGEPIQVLDYDIYDTMLVPLPIGAGDYWLRITEWRDRENGDAKPGEYALYLTMEGLYIGEDAYIDDDYGYRVPAMLAPGSFAAPGPDGVKGAQVMSMADAQRLDYGRLHYGRFNGDQAAGGTSGATGHCYRFVMAD
jgi:thermitase